MNLASLMRTSVEWQMQHFGVPVVSGAMAHFGLVDVEDVWEPDGNDGMVQVRQTVVRVAAAQFPDLERETTLTADGVSYRIRTFGVDPLDGALTRIVVVKE